MTVKEQLLYEIGDPDNYLSPDVTVSFLKLTVEDLGNDRVQVSEAHRQVAPETLKSQCHIPATAFVGWKLTVIGRKCKGQSASRRRICFCSVFWGAGFTLRDTIIRDN